MFQYKLSRLLHSPRAVFSLLLIVFCVSAITYLHLGPHTQIKTTGQQVNVGYGGVFIADRSHNQVSSQAPSDTNPFDILMGLFTGADKGLDPSQIGKALQTAFVFPVFTEIQSLLLKLFIQRSDLNFVWNTPDNMTYDNTTVKGVWNASESLSLSLMGIMLSWEFLCLMLKRSVMDFSDALEVVPKVFFALVAGLLSLYMVKELIIFNNDLCGSLVVNLKQDLFLFQNEFSTLYQMVWLVYAVLWIILAVQGAIRITLINIAISVGPVALLLLASKQTESIGRFWLSTLTASIFMQFFQVLCLYLGMSWLSSIATGDADTIIIKLIVSCAVLYLTMEIPRLFQQAALNAMKSASGAFSNGARLVAGTVMAIVKASV